MANAAAEEVVSTSAPSYTFGVPWPHLNDGLIYTDIAKPGKQASTLIEFYSSKYNYSAPLQGWLQRIRNGQIRVDGEVVTDPGAFLRAGSKLVYHRLPWEEPHAPYLLGVLYEDDDMLALDKPAGLQVLPGGLFQQRTVLTQLQWRSCKENSALCTYKMTVSEEDYPVPVHRLGRGTSGILLCAKTKLARTHLASCFACGTSGVNDNSLQACRTSEMEFGAMRGILKLYRALVRGILDRDEVVIKQPIGVMHYPGVAKGLYVACSSGKLALSKVTVLQRDVEENQTLVQVEIHSGRPHQIRIHLAFIGYPLVGDPLYITGGRPKCFEFESTDDNFAQDGGYNRPLRPVPGDCGFYLNAHHLTFYHPSTNENVEITSPTPSMLQTQEELDQKIPSER